jgi:hypothetical protein
VVSRVWWVRSNGEARYIGIYGEKDRVYNSERSPERDFAKSKSEWLLTASHAFDHSPYHKCSTFFHLALNARLQPPNANERPVNTMSGPYVVP